MTFPSATTAADEVRGPLARAREHQLEADAARIGHPPEPEDPHARARAEVELWAAQGAGGGSVARTLLEVANIPPIAVDSVTLEPTSAVLTSVEQIAEHWRQRRDDGAAVPAGRVSTTDSFLLALRGTPGALRGWLEEAATEEVVKLEDDRVLDVRRVWRDVPNYSTVRQVPPPRRSGIQAVTHGLAALARATDALLNAHTREAAQRPAYLAWIVPPDTGAPRAMVGDQLESPLVERRRLTARSRRLTAGVELLAAGEPIPQHVLQPDGWRLDATMMPMPGATGAQLPEWFARALGAKYVDERLDVRGAWRVVR